MHWQFGGNLEPVQMICEVDWRECPKAIANYVWSEIVTDVLDCLRNESTIWRVLAIFFICIILLRIICFKPKCNDTAMDKNILNKVGYKVEDLELKVNILTYKLQYGTWPLPHQIQKSHFKKNLRNLRLTLSNPNSRNNWIKHVLLSPKQNESYVSYSKYYPSEYHLTELFDAKKKSMYHYLRQENLPLEHSSKSSKSSSDKSLKINSKFRNIINRKHREWFRNENFDAQYRNAISVPLFSRKRYNKSGKILRKGSKNTETRKMSSTCKKYTKTMDDCKRYLKQLHDSNKNLGLIISSSESSNVPPIKNCWSDVQQQRCVPVEDQSKLYEGIEENADKKTEIKEENTENTDKKQENNEQCLELSNTIYPVLQLADKHLLPPKMNISFCADMFPQQLNTKILVPRSCERGKYMKTSQEALYQVKKKLESLHNVLRMYELQNIEVKTSEKQENNNKIDNISQNNTNTLASATIEVHKKKKIKRNKINFNSNARNDSKEIEQTTSNSSEQYESDETGRSSIVSIQNYSNMFNAYRRINNIGDPHYLLMEKFEPKVSHTSNHELDIIPNNQIVYSSSITYEKIPERIYYTISSDSSEGKKIKKKISVSENFTLPDVYIKNNQTKSFSSFDQYPIPMETDEDTIMSPTSSHTEISKESECEDKSTALLLQEALQFKKALLTRVELEKICYVNDQKTEIDNESVLDQSIYSYVDNNFQSKLLDIISEEQSVSSSTEKASRTYMFFNLKQDKQFNDNVLDFTQQNEVRDLITHKKYLDSKHNLDSSSEYFSFCNITQETDRFNSNRLSLSKHNHFQENESLEVISNNLQIKCLNDTLDKSDEKLVTFTNCLDTTKANINEQQTCYDYIYEKERYKEHYIRMNDINEFINRNIDNVELFSQNLDEIPLKEKFESANKNMASNVLDAESSNQYANVRNTKNTKDNTLNVKLNISHSKKYIEDHEILPCNPNLILKRNPGACSLIEQTTLYPNLDKTLEIHNMIATKIPIYELSPSDSKATSLETNLIQDSLTSSINQSNDSNIPEPPSVTVLINKSLNEEKLYLDWSNMNNEFSDDCINDMKTCSTNTITLQKYDITNINNYEKTKICYNENDKVQDEKNNSTVENLFTNLNKKELINEMDFYKSYSNLISPHSSMYFTDEASSSTTKLNTQSKNFRDQSGMYTQNDMKNKLRYEDETLKDIGHTETVSTPMLKKIKKVEITTTINTNTSIIKELSNAPNMEQTLSESNSRTQNEVDSFPSNNYAEDMDTLSIDETKTSKQEKEILSKESAILYDDTNNYNLLFTEKVSTEAPSSSITNNSEKLDSEEYIVSSNLSPRQISPRNTNENKTMKRTNATVKSRSHENYTSKSEKLKKPVTLPNVKNFKSDLLNTIPIKGGNNMIFSKLKDLPTVSRCNTEDNIRLNKKKSQISFQTNESSKDVTPRSYEFPSNVKSMNHTQSFETKLEGPSKPSSPTLRTSSKSCIPILKSRLEVTRKTENKSRPKSPMRGPLTMTMFWKDNLYEKNPNIADEIQVEGKSRNKNPCGNHKQDSIETHIVQNKNENAGNNITSQKQIVIYVNIFTKYDHNTTKIVDPTKFLEYIKNRKLSIQQLEENQIHEKGNEFRKISGEEEKNTIHKIINVVPSVVKDDELDQNITTNLSPLKTQTDSLTNILLNGKLKNICFLSVEQREIDVTAKPSVIDISTSISDLDNISETSKNTINKFQICGTPKELNNEEYIALLEILHQESNFVHLQELQNVCKKLISEY